MDECEEGHILLYDYVLKTNTKRRFEKFKRLGLLC